MTIRKSFTIATIIVFTICVLLSIYAVFAKSYTMYLYSKYKSSPDIYVYDTFSKALNNSYYATSLENAYAVNRFYDSIKLGKKCDMDFDIISLAVDRPVKFIGYYQKDSSIIEFIDIETCCWGYVKGYVSKSTVHLTLPPDTLLKEYKDFWREYSLSHPSIKKYGGEVSEYGFYCNCNDSTH